MKPSFVQDDYQDDEYSILLCPNCGNNNLHHDTIEVFEREEDASIGLHVLVENNKVVEDCSLLGNPSLRRHGITIKFWCEHCDCKPIMNISQHEGQTFIEMESKFESEVSCDDVILPWEESQTLVVDNWGVAEGDALKDLITAMNMFKARNGFSTLPEDTE